MNLSLDNSGPGLKLGQGSLVWERARESLMVTSQLMVESSYKSYKILCNRNDPLTFAKFIKMCVERYEKNTDVSGMLPLPRGLKSRSKRAENA